MLQQIGSSAFRKESDNQDGKELITDWENYLKVRKEFQFWTMFTINADQKNSAEKLFTLLAIHCPVSLFNIIRLSQCASPSLFMSFHFLYFQSFRI